MNDITVETIRPTLDKFTASAEPICRAAAEQVYEHFLNSIQDYLRDNAEWNIGAEIDRCRKIEAESRTLRDNASELLSVLLDMFENPQFHVSIGGNPNMVDALMKRASAAISKATQP